jgi:hypothetical protein
VLESRDTRSVVASANEGCVYFKGPGAGAMTGGAATGGAATGAGGAATGGGGATGAGGASATGGAAMGAGGASTDGGRTTGAGGMPGSGCSAAGGGSDGTGWPVTLGGGGGSWLFDGGGGGSAVVDGGCNNGGGGCGVFGTQPGQPTITGEHGGETVFGSNGPPAQRAVPCHAAVVHLTSFGLMGGQVGSAGLSVHRSVRAGSRLTEAASTIDDAECRLFTPIANPANKAIMAAAVAMVSIKPARFFPHRITTTRSPSCASL